MIPQGPLSRKPKSIIAAKNILYATVILVILGYLIGEFSDGLSALQTMIVIIAILSIIISQIALARRWVRPVFLIIIVIELHAALTLLPFFFSNSLVLGFLFLIQGILQILSLAFLYRRESDGWFYSLKNKAGISIEEE